MKMKKNLLLVMGAAMMLVFGISSCSSSDDEIDLTQKGRFLLCIK